MGYEVKYHDPHVTTWQCERLTTIAEMEQWSDILVIVTAHDDYKGLTSDKYLYDACGLLN